MNRTAIVASLFTLGSILGQGGNFIFRLFALYFIAGQNYIDLSVILRVITFSVILFGLELHGILTRDLRIKRQKSDEIIASYIWSYRIASVIGILAFLILIYITNLSISVPMILISLFGLICAGYEQFFIGITRGTDKIKSASMFLIVEGASRAVLVLISALFIPISLEVMITIWNIGYINGLLWGFYHKSQKHYYNY